MLKQLLHNLHMAHTLRYDIESCSRCGGSGHYSRCQMYGTTCFKCGGKTTTLTRAAAKAAAAIQEFITAHFSVAVETLVVGDRIKLPVEGVTRTVVAIERRAHAFGNGKDANGETLWHDGITLTFNKAVRGAFGHYDSYGIQADALVVKAVAGADWDRVVAFARTIKKGVSVVETPQPEVTHV